MPIYGYICKNCEHTLDALQKMSDEPLVDCPACAEPQLKRQLSAPRFRLKGQGWYETDFKSGNQRNLHSDTEATKKDDKSSDKKAEPEKKTESGDKASKASTPDSKSESTA